MKKQAQILAVSLALYAASAAGGTTTANLTVSATVSATCTATTSPLAFGTYDPTSDTALDATGKVTVTCTAGTAYTVALSAGSNAASAGDVSTRRMSDGASHYLPYQIYLDSSRSTVWGTGSSGSLNPASGSFSGTGSAVDHTAYGRITTGNYVTPASYTDTVVATITF